MAEREAPAPAAAPPLLSPRSLTRLQLAGALAAAAFAGAVLFATARDPASHFLIDRLGAHWLMVAIPVGRSPVYPDVGPVPQATFSTRFSRGAEVGPLRLDLYAFEEVEVRLDDVLVPHPGAKDARRGLVYSLDVSAAGEHRLDVTVTNRRGPPLLLARVEGPGVSRGTDSSWWASVAGRADLRAVLANDTRPYPAVRGFPSAADGLRRRWLPLLAAAVGSAAAFFVLRGRVPAAVSARGPWLAVAGAALTWAVLFAGIQPRLPLWAGPDARSHLEYVRWVREHAAVPLATDGFITYHPPVFYVLEAALDAAVPTTPNGVGERWLLRAIPCLASLAHLLCALGFARLLRPGDVRAATFAVLAAALVPMNWLFALFLSNEGLHGALADAGLLAAAWLLARGRLAAGWLLGAGALLGLAIATKITSLVLAACVGGVLAAQLVLLERRGALRSALSLGAFALGVAAVAGPYFVRNWIHFGTPLLWNFDVPGGQRFWQQPGFHTFEYFGKFGAVLEHPYAASFVSMWDGLYSSLWGDGDTAGLVSLDTWAPLWDLHAMSALYLLAIPATALCAAGLLAWLAAALRGPDLRRRLAHTLVAGSAVALGLGMVQHAIAHPYHSVVKASFALGLLGPLAAGAGAALSSLHAALLRRGYGDAQGFVYAWLGAFAAALVLALHR